MRVSLQSRGAVARWRCWLGFAICVAFAVFCQETAHAQRYQFGTDGVEEPAESLQPRKSRSPEENDRLLAAAEYSYGRLLLQRDDTSRALRHLERAFRWDPRATFIVREIVPSAGSLGRHAEAVRYAIIAAEQDAGEVKLLQPLGEILVQQGDFARAIKLFELALHHSEESDAGAQVLLRAELARLNLLTGKVDRAVELFSTVRAALADPDKAGVTGDTKKQLVEQRARLYPLIGESFFQAKRFDEAIEMFRKWHEVEPNEPRLWVQISRVAVEKKEWKNSSDHLAKYFAAKATGAGAQPYDLLAKTLIGEFGESPETNSKLIAQLTEIRKQDPQNSPLSLYLASKLHEAGQRDAAIEIYKESVKKQPTVAGLRGLARIHRENRNAAELFKLLPAAFEQGATRDFLEDEGEAIVMDAEFLNQLIEHARSADPAKEMLQYTSPVGVALLAIKAKRFEVVEDLWNRASAYPKADQAKARESIGLALLFADQYALAAKMLEGAVDEKAPKEKRAAYYFYLAGALELSGKHEQAMAAAEKCAELDSSSAQFNSRPAWVLYHAKRLDEADQRYRAHLAKFDSKFDNEETRDQMRQARLVLSNIAVMKKQLPEAEEWLEQVLDEYPEDVGAQNDLGYLWADQGKHLNRALAMCQAAVRGEPENGAYRDSLGWAYFRLGQSSDAARELEKAASLTPDGVIFDHLGDAYLQDKQPEKAVAAWEKALESFTKDQDSEKIQQTKAKLDQHRK
jgi:tetratricopeptide (TPR) repeat protein